MKQITLQKPAEKGQCHCKELEKELSEWGERGAVRRPVEDLVVKRELGLLRRWYREWQLGRHSICFCEFLRRRRSRLRGRRRGGSDER